MRLSFIARSTKTLKEVLGINAFVGKASEQYIYIYLINLSARSVGVIDLSGA